MNLDTSLWYVRWFFWSCEVLDYFTKSESARRWESRSENFEDGGTTLCQFIRTMGWGALIYTLQFLVYAITIYVLVVKPFMLFSAASVLTIVGIVGGIIVAAGAALFAIVWMVEKLGEVISDYRDNRPISEETSKPGFLKVFWEFLKAEKRKICPLVNFTGARMSNPASKYYNTFSNPYVQYEDNPIDSVVDPTSAEGEPEVVNTASTEEEPKTDQTDGDKNENV